MDKSKITDKDIRKEIEKYKKEIEKLVWKTIDERMARAKIFKKVK